jgi:hypothetical protein
MLDYRAYKLLWLICLLGLHFLWITDQVRLRKAHTEPFVDKANVFLPVVICGLNAPVIKRSVALLEAGVGGGDLAIELLARGFPSPRRALFAPQAGGVKGQRERRSGLVLAM